MDGGKVKNNFLVEHWRQQKAAEAEAKAKKASSASGVVALKVVEQRKPAEEPMADGQVIVIEEEDEISRLERELAEKKALVPTNQPRGLVTAGMAAKKPSTALNETNKKHSVITNLGGCERALAYA